MKMLCIIAIACSLAACNTMSDVQPNPDHVAAMNAYVMQCKRAGHSEFDCEEHMDKAFGMDTTIEDGVFDGMMAWEMMQ